MYKQGSSELTDIKQGSLAVTDLQNKLQRLASLPAYLAELGILVRRDVDAGELLSVHEMSLIRERFISSPKGPTIRASLPFERRKSDSFVAMIDQLHDLSACPVVLWPPNANDCGLLLLSTIKEIDFGFPIDLNPEGILVIATSDGLNRMLLDFSVDEDKVPVLEIEIQGPQWSLAALPT